jgi:hypothetical protein
MVILEGLAVVAVLPFLAYFVAKMATVGHLKGKEVFYKYLKQKEESTNGNGI